MPDQMPLERLIVRERQSRELAAEAGDVAVKRAHLGMADGYAQRIADANSVAEKKAI